MFEIQIFKAEKDAGLEEKIRTTARVSFASIAEVVDAVKLSEKVLARISHFAKAENQGQPDLHYFKSILVSTGINKNDDVFDTQETWAARHTPEDKQVNYEHNQDDIIGHMTGCYVIGSDNEVVADNTVIDDLPGKFHIVTSGVLYKIWSDEELQERMDNLITETAKGEWFVSMEALFNNFDYALVENNKMKVVARNKETAFLTKHLRAYGGDGKYGKAKVARILKNIVFSGKGYTRKPANPESIILASDKTVDLAQAEILQTFAELGYENMSKKTINEESKTMANENTNTDKTLEAKVAELTAANEKLQSELRDTNTKELTTKAEKLEKASAEKDAKITALESDLKVKSDESLATKTKLDEVTKAHVEATEKLAKIEAEQKRQERISVIASKLELAKDKAEKLVDKLATLSDDQFTAAIETQVEMKAEASKIVKTEEKVEENKEVDAKGEKTVANTNLEKVETKTEISLASENANSGVEEVQKAIAARYENKNKKKSK